MHKAGLEPTQTHFLVTEERRAGQLRQGPWSAVWAPLAIGCGQGGSEGRLEEVALGLARVCGHSDHRGNTYMYL